MASASNSKTNIEWNRNLTSGDQHPRQRQSGGASGVRSARRPVDPHVGRRRHLHAAAQRGGRPPHQHLLSGHRREHPLRRKVARRTRRNGLEGFFFRPERPYAFFVFLNEAVGFFWQVRSACWALDKGISVVICNGMAENAVRDIVAGRKLGTFFTDYRNGGTSVETAAEQGTDTWVHKKQTTQFLLARYITEMQCDSRDRSFVPLQKNPSKKKIH